DTPTLTIEEMAKLSPLDYGKVRTAQAEKHGVRVSDLDRAVAEEMRRVTRSASGGGMGIINLAPREPWAEPVSADAVLDAIVHELGKYIYAPDCAKDAVALWVVASYALNAFFIFPRLHLKSATKGCGKSTLLDILEQLTDKPLIPSNITGPA